MGENGCNLSLSEMSYKRKKIVGGPAAKFVYYIIRSHHPIDQTRLIRLTDLPRRTIQGVIEELKSQGLITESSGTDDARKKVYDLV